MEYLAGTTDVAVIGAGHAGAEAALASARLGMRVILFSLSLDAVANMPCNPSIGGTAKGHLVREIDALGGEMGRAADAVTIHSRMLNKGKGPAVHSLRAQVDRDAYRIHMKRLLENQPGLNLRQAEIAGIRLDPNGRVCAVITDLGAVYETQAVILCTGTYLRAKTFIGDCVRESGPDGLHPANRLSESLLRLGLPLRRFKTGTPARVHRDSIDFSRLEIQLGDEPPVPFSFETTAPVKNRTVCHIAYTNSETHRVIRENLDRSPLYGGLITGTGTRYCPSIEDKIVRFSDKPRHQIFVEPMGLSTAETYLSGSSSSLPEDVQLAFYRTIEGFEHLQIMRNAYAIEYDCVDPLALRPSLEFLRVPGLFSAGQFNGTSGYEEAAAQGLVAGINAANSISGKPPLVLSRSSSYIGTLVDDLTAKGCTDPYRMMTSRSEYRLLLRQDNADMRLTPIGRDAGLISDARWQRFLLKSEQVEKEVRRIRSSVISPSDALNAMIVSRGTSPVSTCVKLAELLRRPQLTYQDMEPFDPERPRLSAEAAEQAELTVKYDGYIQKQMLQAEQLSRLESVLLPEDIDYAALSGIRLEAKEKLAKIRPHSLGQASRISGVTPADISVLHIYLGGRSK